MRGKSFSGCSHHPVAFGATPLGQENATYRIVCAGVVLAGTDFGAAPRRLAALLAALTADIAGKFGSTLALAGAGAPDTQPARRELIRQVIALDPVIDETIGESSTLRFHSPVLQAVGVGLFAALAGWRTIAERLTRLPDAVARREAAAVLRLIPQELRSAPQQGGPADPIHLRRLCHGAVRGLLAMPAGTPSLRLLADQTAKLLAGMSRALDGLALLLAVWQPSSARHGTKFHVPDWLPCVVNGARAFVTIGAVELFWIATQWPHGDLAITFAAVGVILFAPRADAAYGQTAGFMIGVALAEASGLLRPISKPARPTLATCLRPGLSPPTVRDTVQPAGSLSVR